MSTETPLTDDQILLRWSGEPGIVPADFARGLELRLAASTAALAETKAAITGIQGWIEDYNRECDPEETIPAQLITMLYTLAAQ